MCNLASDMIIEQADRIIHLCEMKFCMDTYRIKPGYGMTFLILDDYDDTAIWWSPRASEVFIQGIAGKTSAWMDTVSLAQCLFIYEVHVPLPSARKRRAKGHENIDNFIDVIYSINGSADFLLPAQNVIEPIIFSKNTVKDAAKIEHGTVVQQSGRIHVETV